MLEMIQTWWDLWRDPQFSLKIIVLIIGAVVNIFILETVDRSYYAIITIGYHYSFLSVVVSLLIANVWFGTSVKSEISLLTVAVVKLIVCTIIYKHSNSEGYINYLHESDAKAQFYSFNNLSREHKLAILTMLNITSIIIIISDIYLRIARK